MKPNLTAIRVYRYTAILTQYFVFLFLPALTTAFRQKHKDYLARVSQLDTVTAERDQQRQEYDALRKQRLDMFMDGFSQITLKLKEMYQVQQLILS